MGHEGGHVTELATPNPDKLARQEAAQNYASTDSRIRALNKEIRGLETEREKALDQQQRQRQFLGHSVGNNLSTRTFLLTGARALKVTHNPLGPQFATIDLSDVEQLT